MCEAYMKVGARVPMAGKESAKQVKNGQKQNRGRRQSIPGGAGFNRTVLEGPTSKELIGCESALWQYLATSISDRRDRKQGPRNGACLAQQTPRGIPPCSSIPTSEPFGFLAGGSHDFIDLRCTKYCVYLNVGTTLTKTWYFSLCLKEHKIAKVKFFLANPLMFYDCLIYNVLKGAGFSGWITGLYNHLR